MSDDNLVSRIYSNFRGVDFRGEEINLVRSPDSLNVWKDYKETESIRTRPGMEYYHDYLEPIHNIYFFKDKMFVHSGTTLYCGKDDVLIDVSDHPTPGLVYDDKFYFFTGKDYGILWITEDGTVDSERTHGYIPTTSIARKPAGGGKTHENINMLTPARKNSFLGDGESTEYYLDATNIDDITNSNDDWVPPHATVNDEDLIYGDDYTVDYEKGIIKFVTAPPAPLTVGQDNVVIRFRKTVPGYRERITNCTLFQIFDNRLFVSGNPDYPNMIWHSSLYDPTYFSDQDCYEEGRDEAAVRGLVAGNNALWVFREPSDMDTTVFYHTPTIDDEYGKVYPSSHSSIPTGCIGRAINFNDDIVFFSERGMEGISGDITTEQVLAHRSTLVDRKMTVEAEYKNMKLAEWQGYLMVFIGTKVYLADSRATFTNENHFEYEWFYWNLDFEVTCATVRDGVLYLGSSAGVVATLTYTPGDEGSYQPASESYWTTPKDKFKFPQMLKTTNKRGCVVEAKGDLSLYVKLEDTDFELIGNYNNVTDYFVSRIKRKKFKDIQLKFYSETQFSLETATLECFVGGYIKR